ncbi:hypothetical protein NT05LM_1224 [Listeria marthii FSL S4-120]|uniref:Uncharacterized protein n=1 Tax=Listeria marthii FSL S4-120 TaxID=702457 RepID=A0ABN0BYJ1_9LIST|nr:hypothetical protein NT05LM_1224 [Listeria marthii FSL S4-120]
MAMLFYIFPHSWFLRHILFLSLYYQILSQTARITQGFWKYSEKEIILN